MLDANKEDNIPILKQRNKPRYIRKYGKQFSDYLHYSKIKSKILSHILTYYTV